MTVVAVRTPPAILCPSWCAVSHESHVADLPDHEGFVIHWSAEGRVQLAMAAYIDGTPDPEDPPAVFVRGAVDGMSLDDAEQLAGALLAAVREARSVGDGDA